MIERTITAQEIVARDTGRGGGPSTARKTRTARRSVSAGDAGLAAGSAVARVEGAGDTEAIVVRDGTGRALFEYYATSGKCVVHAPEGDLELRADHGSVTVVARDAVSLRGDRRIDLATPSLTTTAARAEVFVGDARLVAKSLRTMVETVRHTAGVLEIEAKRIVERAKCTYRDVEELAQTRAGRMRSVVETTFHVLSKTAIIKAEEDVKLKGKKIHLA